MSNGKQEEGAEKGRAGRAGWTIAIISAFAVVVLIGSIWAPPGVRLLRDPLFARGLITFLISISTIGISFLLIYQAFYGVPPEDDRFKRAREVFTGLMGVLGTIVGFYFGASQTSIAGPELADIRVVDNQLITHITGGSPPYTYTLRVGEKELGPVRQRVAPDGWISQTLSAGLDGVLSLEVVDSLDHRASKQYKLTASSPATQQRSELTPTRPQ